MEIKCFAGELAQKKLIESVAVNIPENIYHENPK